MLDLYEFNIDLFGNGEAEEFLLFVQNFNMTLAMSGMLEMGANIPYQLSLFFRYFLHPSDSFSDNVEGVIPLTVKTIILGLVLYFPPESSLSNKKHAMQRGMRKVHGIKVSLYTASLIDRNNYLYLLPGATLSNNIRVTELNEVLLNIMPKSWRKQAYVQGYERVYITEYTHEGVVKPYYKQSTRSYATIAGHSRKKR